MYAASAIFASSRVAEKAVQRLLAHGASRHRLTVLVPGVSDAQVERRIPLDDGEAPGTGAAIAGVVGGAIGLATASLVLPGVGPIVVAGLLAAGLVGVAGGGSLGDQLEHALSAGLPRDELAGYLDALHIGRTVVIVSDERKEEIDEARRVLERVGEVTGGYASASP
jgi:hypothetical protein